MAYNQYDLANTSLVKTGILSEMYIPLWYYSSGVVSQATTGSYTYIQKGSASPITNTLGSTTKLHTLNTNWSPNQKFALEISVYSSVPQTGYVQLFDVTGTTTGVSASQIATTATTATVMRSGQFTLTPGHTYALGMYNSSGTIYLTKASLIAFLS